MEWGRRIKVSHFHLYWNDKEFLCLVVWLNLGLCQAKQLKCLQAALAGLISQTMNWFGL